MTRRIVSVFLICLLIVGVVLPYAAAAMPDASGEVICFEDGSYMVTMITGTDSRASGSLTKTKISTYHSSSGDALWAVSVTASFSYTGTSSTCTSSSGNVSIYNSAWYEISCSASRSGNTATCNAEVGKKFLGITVTKVPHTVTLTCDKNGNVS